MACTNCHIFNIPRGIVNAVRDDLPIGKYGKIIIKRFLLSFNQNFSVALELANEFFLFGINTDHRKSDLPTCCPYGRDILKLCISVLNLHYS